MVGSIKLHQMSAVATTMYEMSYTHFMNLSTAPVPHGNFNGRSNVFPNKMSSAEQGTKNLPAGQVNSQVWLSDEQI
jgi:hypothetical protein